MLKRSLNSVNRLALKHLGRQWVDYIASNTMTEFNRRHNDFIWTYELKALIVDIKTEADDVNVEAGRCACSPVPMTEAHPPGAKARRPRSPLATRARGAGLC